MKSILIRGDKNWQYWAEVEEDGTTSGEYGICIDPECDCEGYIRYW